MLDARTKDLPGTRQPRLSVVIPNYNDGRFLERCLCAVLTQNRLPDEIVVFDDCSTDNSLEIIERLHQRWPLFQVVQGDKNQGVNLVLNQILRQIKNEWVHFLATDDCPLPGYYHLAMKYAQLYPQAGALFGGFVTSDEVTGERFVETADKWIEPGYISPKRMLWQLFHKAPALFSLGYANIWRAEALREVGGFSPELGAYSDTVAFRNVTARHGGVYLGGAPLVCVRVSRESYGGQVWKNVKLYAKTLDLAAQIMRTRFSGLFPERFIRNWEAKIPSEIGLRPWPKWRRAKHGASWALYRFWLAITRLLGR